MMKSDIKAAILAFVGLLLALIIGAACGLLLLAFHNQTKVLRFLFAWLFARLFVG